MKRIIAAIAVFAMMLSYAADRCGADTSDGLEGSSCVRLPIIMYHHVSLDKSCLGEYIISPDILESDMEYLHERGYETVTVGDLTAYCEGEIALPDKPFMITFDDAHESVAAYAAPILRRYNFTGVISVVGAYSLQFSGTPDHPLAYSYLSWEELHDISQGNVFEIACHTYDMHKQGPRKGCTPKPGEGLESYRVAFTDDLKKFDELCEKYRVDRSSAFAFPFGSYKKSSIEILREYGYSLAFSCRERINVLTGDPDDLFCLGRFNRPNNISSEKFFSKWDRK